MAPREKDSALRSPESCTSISTHGGDESPIIAASRHLLKPNGSIVGRQVAEAILPSFPTFASAIPTELEPRPALASVDGRLALTHARIRQFCVDEFGPALHQLGFGRGDRIALILPNGPELALALVATAHWASAVPLNANGAVSELEADLARCGADLVIGPYSGPLAAKAHHEHSSFDDRFHVMADDKDWAAFWSIEESAHKLNVPFCGLIPSLTESGIFRLELERV